ncbi:hypothetical protein O0I10_008573 [Lichtheimia ornata]|uniref:Uncharacterized protein n=1 Tax=Lichtheimia ornata TaxID=688661 RepID=A0AAD7XWN1_9FUNG|nr:uncharacterized protein O0I10_008573 [Lichtheimia ornata]KAJ8655688.1 hypothetical protein O0I10_008573 [Lichtheimia ornata]
MSNRYRERKFNSSDNDRLARALSQPVQAWEKAWSPVSNGKGVKVYKWIKSERSIVFEEEEDNEEDTMSGVEKTEPPPSMSAILQSKEEEEGRSATPKLDDLSDTGSEQQLNVDADENDVNDPSKNPASNPHVHPREEDVENRNTHGA